MTWIGTWVRPGGAGLFGDLGGVSAVALEDSGRGKLAEAVADHVFGDGDVDEVLAVVHEEHEADEVRRDHGRAGPGLDWLLGPGCHLGNFPEQLLVNVRSFFK